MRLERRGTGREKTSGQYTYRWRIERGSWDVNTKFEFS